MVSSDVSDYSIPENHLEGIPVETHCQKKTKVHLDYAENRVKRVQEDFSRKWFDLWIRCQKQADRQLQQKSSDPEAGQRRDLEGSSAGIPWRSPASNDNTTASHLLAQVPRVAQEQPHYFYDYVDDVDGYEDDLISRSEQAVL